MLQGWAWLSRFRGLSVPGYSSWLILPCSPHGRNGRPAQWKFRRLRNVRCNILFHRPLCSHRQDWCISLNWACWPWLSLIEVWADLGAYDAERLEKDGRSDSRQRWKASAMPASTGIKWPVVQRARALARNKMASAQSAGTISFRVSVRSPRYEINRLRSSSSVNCP